MSGRLDESVLLRAPGVAEAILGEAPAWVWDVEQGRVLLSSAAGIAFFDETEFEALAARRFDMARPGMVQLARLGRSLPRDGRARLSLLRFFVGVRDVSVPCQCRLLADLGLNIVLVVAGAKPRSRTSLAERFRAACGSLSTPLLLKGASGEVRRNRAAVELGAEPAGAGTVDIATPEGRFTLIVGRPVAEAAEEAPGKAPEEAVRPEAPVAAAQAGPETEAETEAAGVGRVEDAGAAPPPSPSARALPETRRFTFQLDAEGRFVEVGAGFAALVGERAADVVGKSIADIDAAREIDVDGALAKALGSRDTWSDVLIDWPTDYGEIARLRLSALPRFGEGRAFVGYRGFADLLSVTAAEAPPEEPSAEPGVREAEPEPAEQPAAVVPEPAPVAAAAPEAPEPAEEVAAEEEPEAAEERVEEVVEEERARAAGGEGSRVLRLHPFKPATSEGGALNDQERSAFKAIAEALGARWAGQPEEEAEAAEPAAEAPAETAKPRPERPAATAEELAEAVERLAEAAPAAPSAGPEPVSGKDIVFEVIDRVPLGLAILRDRQVLAANRAFLELFGYTDIDDLEIAGGIGAIIEGRGEGAEPGTAVTARRRDGETFPVEVRLGRTPWVDGPAMMMSVRAAETKVEPVEEAPAADLKAVLDTAFDGVFVLDADGTILSANATGARLAGADPAALAGRRFTDLVVEADRSAVADLLQSLTEGGIPSVLEKGREITLEGDGEPVPVQFSLGRVGTQEPPQTCVVLRDLTEWKEAEADLVAARKRAEDASAQKSDFLAKMSHEIRTPLNGIIGFSEVILEERFGPLGNDRYREYVKDIRESGEHLMSLVNDLLDLSKVEAGKLEMAFTNLRLNDLVEQCVAVMQPQSSRARVIIRTSLPATLPGVVADARSIRQVLLNILSNAIKFTPPGGQVIVSTALGDTGEVHLRVRDTGVGMSQSDVATALEPFRQLPTAPSTGERGTGLGLPLAKALAEANRATFSLTSRPGEGTLVEITFPQQRVLAE